MKQLKLLKAALTIGNIFCILLITISSIINGIDSHYAPLLFVTTPILIIPLVLLTIYGFRAYQKENDSDSYFALLAISALFNLAYLFIVYRFVVDPKLLFPWLLFEIFSILMLLLWVLNVIAFLKRDK
jgi:hypothetical protein